MTVLAREPILGRKRQVHASDKTGRIWCVLIGHRAGAVPSNNGVVSTPARTRSGHWLHEPAGTKNAVSKSNKSRSKPGIFFTRQHACIDRAKLADLIPLLTTVITGLFDTIWLTEFTHGQFLIDQVTYFCCANTINKQQYDFSSLTC